MDGGSLCQPHAAAITPAAMMDGGERKGGGRDGDGEREIQRGASITPLNLPVTAQAWIGKGGGVSFTQAAGQWFNSFLYTLFAPSCFWRRTDLNGLNSLNVPN